MMDVLFLDQHAGWSFTDLMAAPDELIAALRLLDYEKAKAKVKK